MFTVAVITYFCLAFIDCLIVEPEVEDLQAVADYRTLWLTWTSKVPPPSVFIVDYCDADRRHHCLRRRINESETQTLVATSDGERTWRYGVAIDGLRLSTKYDVRVINAQQLPETMHNQWITVATKGFTAKVTRCLPEFTEMEVDTGPYFSGRVEVEGSKDERCSFIGDASSPRTRYVLLISHDLCPIRKAGHLVESVVVANESPSIITAASRRFNVVCDLLPDAFTIQATVNLSASADGATVRDAVQPRMESISQRKAYEDALYQPNTGGHLASMIGGGALVVLLVLGIGALCAFLAVRTWRRKRSGGAVDEEASIANPLDVALMAHRPNSQLTLY